MTDNNIENRKKRDVDIKASFALDDIKFSDKDEAMFKMFDDKGWSTEQCIEYIRKSAKQDK